MRSVAVDVHEVLDLVAAGVQLVPVDDHPRLELVEDEDLRGQIVVLDEVGEPLASRVDLIDLDLADLLHVAPARLQTPFGIECEPDMRLEEQILIQLRLGEEIGVSGLQIQDTVDAGLLRGVDERQEFLRGRLVGVVLILAGRGGSHRRDDLERGDDLSARQRLVLGGKFLHAIDGLRGPLLAQEPQRSSGGMPIQGDHQLVRVGRDAAPGNLGRHLRHGHSARKTLLVTKVPERQDRRGVAYHCNRVGRGSRILVGERVQLDACSVEHGARRGVWLGVGQVDRDGVRPRLGGGVELRWILEQFAVTDFRLVSLQRQHRSCAEAIQLAQ